MTARQSSEMLEVPMATAESTLPRGRQDVTWRRRSAAAHRTARAAGVEILVAGLALTALAAAVFGTHIAHGGLYNDDWQFLRNTYFAHGFPAALDTFSASNSYRPGSMLYFAFEFRTLGPHGAWHLIWTALTGVAMSLALFALLRELRVARFEAGAVAALVLLFPASDATRLWASASVASVGITLYLLGSLVALRGLRLQGRRAAAVHAAALALYAASVLTYEIAAGAILASILLYRLRVGWREAAKRWIFDVALVVPILELVTSKTFYHRLPPLQMARHAGHVAAQGAAILTDAAFPFVHVPRGIGLALLALVAAGIWAAARRLPDELARNARRRLKIAAAGLVAAAAGYLVIIPSAQHSPLAPGQENRVNALAAIGFVILLWALAAAAGTVLLRAPRRGSAAAMAVALLLGAGYVVEVRRDASRFDRASALQQAERAAIGRAIGHPAPGAVVLAYGGPAYVAPGVPVFAAPWDLNGALAMQLKDKTISARTILPSTRLSCSSGSLLFESPGERFAVPFAHLYLVDTRSGTAARPTDRVSCEAAARKAAS